MDHEVLARVTKAAVAEMTPDVQEGRVTKVLYVDDLGNKVGEHASQALPENQFYGQMQGLQEPPFSLEQLVWLAETHHVHSAAIEQKVADIVGKGWSWSSPDDKDADPQERDDLEAWFQSLAPGEEDMKEVLTATWDDVETTGQGYIEFTRDPSGIVRRAYHVPSHTIRAEKTGFKLCQVREQRKVWFKRWGAVDDAGKPVRVDSVTGSMTNVRDEASDLFVIKRPSRRSTWYGIPGYVSAIGWITLALAARDDNLMLFANRREPRWAVILKGITDTANGEPLEEQIRRAFTVDLKSPHRNIIIPLSAGDITFQKMSADLKQDGSFDQLMGRADTAIMIAHRVPADRLANATVGALGGSNNVAANRVYKDGVVTAGQEVLNSRLNAFIKAEYPNSTLATKRRREMRKASVAAGVTDVAETPEPIPWSLVMEDLDVETAADELNIIVQKFKSDLITLREARAALKMEPLMKPAPPETLADGTSNPDYSVDAEEEESDLNDKLYSELPGIGKDTGTGSVGGLGGSGGLGIDGITPGDGGAQEARDVVLQSVQQDVREVLRQSRDTSNRLDEALDEPRSS